jgi:cobalt-zinc-cadmium efflux system protein
VANVGGYYGCVAGAGTADGVSLLDDPAFFSTTGQTGVGSPTTRTSRRADHREVVLWAVLAANLALVGVLAGVGLVAHSLGVWAEGADYLGDAGGIALVLLARHLEQVPPTENRPRGYPRAKRYAALANAGWLVATSLAVAGGALARLAAGAGEVHGLDVLVVSAASALVMGSAALVLRGEPAGGAGDASGEDFSLSAVMLDTVADSAAAGGVAAAGTAMYVMRGAYWLDPSAALVISLVVAYQGARLIARAGASLRTADGTVRART